MKTLLCLCFTVMNVFATYPQGGYFRSPGRTVMFGGYYGQPTESRSYIPQGSVTFAAGDSIATNAFVGDQSPFEAQTSVEETTEKRRSSTNYGEDLDLEPSSTVKPKRNPKRKPSNEDNDNDDEDLPSSWPFNSGRNGVPSYNAFFPIMLGGMSGYGRKAGSDANNDGYYPGSATAIANSFSTGKGGVATSHATSFGDPYLSTLFRNGNFNKKGLRPTQEEK